MQIHYWIIYIKVSLQRFRQEKCYIGKLVGMIRINEVDYSQNNRRLIIVDFDENPGKVINSVVFNTHNVGCLLSR